MNDWQNVNTQDLAAAIAEFSAALPGWWFSIGACSVSCDASCGPDRNGADALLLQHQEFDEGFHCDLHDGSVADALRRVTQDGIRARAALAVARPAIEVTLTAAQAERAAWYGEVDRLRAALATAQADMREKLEKMQRSRDRYRQAWEAEKARAALVGAASKGESE